MRAADEERGLDGLEDEQLLELAVEETRMMITFDVKDFTVLARRWAEAGRTHAGVWIVVGIDHASSARSSTHSRASWTRRLRNPNGPT